MDVSILTTFLAPFLPYLLKAGEKAIEEAGKKLGEKFGGDTWERAKSLWAKLSPKVESDPGTKALVQNVANALEKNPADEIAKSTLQFQIKTLMENDPTLANEISRLFEEAKQTGSVSNVIASGVRAVAIGGNASGNTISTGDTVTHNNESKATNP
ncbi:hypothetical protein JYQ62_07180 [Nostoc sp. UHCC 0702]|nr:hypothetical protein JYQ62_07180 [Nostoc sp. UHCC 0702]